MVDLPVPALPVRKNDLPAWAKSIACCISALISRSMGIESACGSSMSLSARRGSGVSVASPARKDSKSSLGPVEDSIALILARSSSPVYGFFRTMGQSYTRGGTRAGVSEGGGRNVS